MNRKSLSLWIAAVFIALPLAVADATSTDTITPAVVPTPTASTWTWNGETGFDWSARPNHTHVEMDGTQSINRVNLDPINTPFLDLELTGLPPNLPVTITPTIGRPFEDATYADGRIVVWNVPTTDLTITVKDHAGNLLTTAVMSYNIVIPMAAAAGNTGTGGVARPCGQCGDPGSTWEDTHSYTWERTNVITYINGVKSFTSDITARIDACWEHINAIGFSVSGGYAAASGTAGGTKTHTQNVCSGTSSTNGVGQISGPAQQFEKDTYRDGSYKIYAIAPTYGMDSTTWYWNPSKCCYFLGFENCASNPGLYYALSEKNSGAVTFSGAWNAWGVSGSVTTSSTTTNSATLRFDCRAPDNAHHSYTFYVVAGDGQTSGMVGAIWKDN